MFHYLCVLRLKRKWSEERQNVHIFLGNIFPKYNELVQERMYFDMRTGAGAPQQKPGVFIGLQEAV